MILPNTFHTTGGKKYFQGLLKVNTILFMKLIFLLHVAATGLMAGVIWFVQMEHYPLFGAVGAEAFPQYEVMHRSATGLLVAPLMLLELGTGLWLLWQAPTGLPTWIPWVGIALLGLIWASTFWVQVPLHDKLLGQQSGEAIQRLVQSNWIRTIAWTLRMGCLGWGIFALIAGR